MDQQSWLLQLPRELRDKILFYACEGRVFKVHERHISKLTTILRYPGLRFDVNLLLVNHQLCEEVMDATTAAYLGNTFHFESPTILKDFALKLAGNDIAAIRSLCIDLTALDYDASPSRRWFFALSDVLVDHFLGLRDLRIYKELKARLRQSKSALVFGPSPVSSSNMRTPYRVLGERRTKYCRMRRLPKPESKHPDDGVE